MDAAALFREGKLSAAVDAQIALVKASPADHSKRLFLFELLSLAGELDRAKKQVDVIDYKEIELQAAITDYRRLLESERARRKLFSEGLLPTFLTDPPEHVRLRLEAVMRLRENHQAEAVELLQQAAEATPEVSGKLNGKPFVGLADGDEVLSGVLEVMAMGNYFWVPFEAIETLAINPPRFSRDLLWIPARLETAVGESGQVFLPSLYPNSHLHADDQVKLGRATDWESQTDGPVLGKGSKTFLVGDDTHGILEWRELVLDLPEQPLAAGAADE